MRPITVVNEFLDWARKLSTSRKAADAPPATLPPLARTLLLQRKLFGRIPSMYHETLKDWLQLCQHDPFVRKAGRPETSNYGLYCYLRSPTLLEIIGSLSKDIQFNIYNPDNRLKVQETDPDPDGLPVHILPGLSEDQANETLGHFQTLSGGRGVLGGTASGIFLGKRMLKLPGAPLKATIETNPEHFQPAASNEFLFKDAVLLTKSESSDESSEK